MALSGDLRAFVAAAHKELRVIRRYPLNYVGGLFWGALLPAVYVLMGQAYSGNSDPRAIAVLVGCHGAPCIREPIAAAAHVDRSR